MKAKNEIHLTEKEIKRFWSNVDIRGEDECWLWKLSQRGGQKGNGYGQMKIRHFPFVKVYSAHRISFVVSNSRQIKKGYSIAHLPIICHNRLCCNPKHLQEKTSAENMADRVLDGTLARGEKIGNSKITEEDAIEIHVLFNNGVNPKVIAKEKNISWGEVYNVLSRKVWKHINLK